MAAPGVAHLQYVSFRADSFSSTASRQLNTGCAAQTPHDARPPARGKSRAPLPPPQEGQQPRHPPPPSHPPRHPRTSSGKRRLENTLPTLGSAPSPPGPASSACWRRSTARWHSALPARTPGWGAGGERRGEESGRAVRAAPSRGAVVAVAARPRGR